MRLTLRVLGRRVRWARACAREGASQACCLYHQLLPPVPTAHHQGLCGNNCTLLSIVALVPLTRVLLRQSDGLIEKKKSL